MKRKIYIISTIVLCLLVIFVLYAISEIYYIYYMLGKGLVVKHICTFDVVRMIIGVLGGIGGFFLGKTWWRIIYVEKRYKFLFKK